MTTETTTETTTSPDGTHITNNIVFNVNGPIQPATKHHAPHHAPHAAPVASQPAPGLHDTYPAAVAPAALKPEYFTDETTHAQTTRILSADGTYGAYLTENPKDHNATTLKLFDAKGNIVTQGDVRGFSSNTYAHINGFDATDANRLMSDTLHCGNSKTDLNNNETESVARERLQQFAKDHPDVAAALRAVPLPVTQMGGLPVTFAQAVDTPTQYRACPTDNRDNVLLERLTHESAARR